LLDFLFATSDWVRPATYFRNIRKLCISSRTPEKATVAAPERSGFIRFVTFTAA
jgi:hypothetical protein